MERRVIRIAGAGPAGLSAAAVLARRGFEVELHEAREGIASRWRRGLQIIENFTEEGDVLERFCESGLKINFFSHPIRRVCLSDGRGHRAEIESPLPFGYFVKRGDYETALDRGLLDGAREAGVKIFFRSRKNPSDGVDIFSGGPSRADGIGKEVTFRTAAPDRMHVVLDPRLAPGGYAYLFVVGGEATLGMAVLHHFDRVDSYFEKTLDFFRREENIETGEAETSVSFANFFIRAPADDARTIWIGEAAGFQDYLFGFGIRFAVESGILAARSIAEGVPFSGLWARQLKPKIETSLWNRFLYEIGGRWLPWILIEGARRSSDLRAYMRAWYRSHLLKDLTLWAVKRWWKKRDLVTGPGPGLGPGPGPVT